MTKLATLDKMIARKEARVDAAEEAGDENAAAIQQEILNTLYQLRDEMEEDAERRESERPRRAAEARLRFHEENDTLDLY